MRRTILILLIICLIPFVAQAFTWNGQTISTWNGKTLSTWNGATISAAAYPAWGGEVTLFYQLDSTSTTVITLTGVQTIPAGARSVIAVSTYSATETVGDVTDSKNGTWGSSLVSENWETTRNDYIFSRVSTLALVAGDTITITWTNPGYSYRWGLVGYLSNTGVTQPDVTKSDPNDYGTSLSIAGITASTVSTNTVIFGLLGNDGSVNWNSNGWSIADSDTRGPFKTYYAYKNLTSSGPQNPGGVWASSTSWGCIWAAFK